MLLWRELCVLCIIEGSLDLAGDERKIRVGVLFGGQSSEHEVSLASARSVMQALDTQKYVVVPIGITKGGRWLTSGDPMLQLRSGAPFPDELDSMSVLAPDPEHTGKALLLPVGGAGNSGAIAQPLDVIIPVLHGPYGEDGTIQGLLEMANIPYAGSGVLGSAVSMDKDMMKKAFIVQGLPVGPYVLVKRHVWEQSPGGVQAEVERRLQYPLFAKPANMGSSVGVTKIHEPGEFASAVDTAARYDERIIVEQGLDARECECGVLGNDDPQASVVGEIVPGNEFYDYRAKYVDDNSGLVIPADLPPQLSEEVRRLAVEAFVAVDAAGMARVDFFVARDLSQVWVNEINTIPGFTRISMYPKLWEASGVAYSQLLDRLIALAFDRHARRRRNKAALDELGEALNV